MQQEWPTLATYVYTHNSFQTVYSSNLTFAVKDLFPLYTAYDIIIRLVGGLKSTIAIVYCYVPAIPLLKSCYPLHYLVWLQAWVSLRYCTAWNYFIVPHLMRSNLASNGRWQQLLLISYIMSWLKVLNISLHALTLDLCNLNKMWQASILFLRKQKSVSSCHTSVPRCPLFFFSLFLGGVIDVNNDARGVDPTRWWCICKFSLKAACINTSGVTLFVILSYINTQYCIHTVWIRTSQFTISFLSELNASLENSGGKFKARWNIWHFGGPHYTRVCIWIS